MEFQLGSFAPAVEAGLKEAEQVEVVKRIWRHDASLWKADEASQKIIKTARLADRNRRNAEGRR